MITYKHLFLFEISIFYLKIDDINCHGYDWMYNQSLPFDLTADFLFKMTWAILVSEDILINL